MFKFLRKKKNKKGFTLIELIIVIALLGVIAAIAVPRYGGVLEQSRVSSDAITLEMVEKAAELYNFQNPDSTRTSITISELHTNGYIDSATINGQSSGNTSKSPSITVSGANITVTWTE
jgi:type IV pilus assembly protein PilA